MPCKHRAGGSIPPTSISEEGLYFEAIYGPFFIVSVRFFERPE